MFNFDYDIPTKIFFGKGQIEVLGKQIKKYGSKVLLTYGKGSIKRNNIYDDVVNALKAEEIEFVELGGIDPNPRIESVREGVQICRDNDVDFILAVGGGSIIDCSKIIALGYHYDGAAWDILTGKAEVNEALAVGAILTMAGTGSEMNAGAVVSDVKTKEKLFTANPATTPKFSILDPTNTFTVSKYQTASGTADMMSHALENYFSLNDGAYLQDRLAEGIIKTCIEYGRTAVKEPENYEARANLMWAATLAINGIISYGKNVIWSVHTISHELTAYYDLPHGISLAILTPAWMEYVLDDERVDKFVEYGINVWGIDQNQEKYDIANEAIEKTREFFASLEIPMTLGEAGIGDENLENMAKDAIDVAGGVIGNFKPLYYEDVLAILKKVL